MSLDQTWEKVREFHEKFGHPYRDLPRFMHSERAEKRYNWMQEEIDEFLEAEDIYEQADAMIDLIYFALGTMVELGVKPDQLFDIVHRANMEKLFSDGTPHYNNEGKTIKPENWEDPYPKIKQEIDDQEKMRN